MLFAARSVNSIFSRGEKHDCTAGFLHGGLFLPHRGISLRQRYHKGGIVWLISVELLQRVARLFSSKLCSSRIASEPLNDSEPNLIRGLGVIRIKTKLSQSTL